MASLARLTLGEDWKAVEACLQTVALTKSSSCVTWVEGLFSRTGNPTDFAQI